MNTSDNQIQTYAKRLQKMIQCKVDVEGEWKYDGFSGQIAEGKIWGRGTVDTKTPLFAEFLNPQITVMFQYMTLYCKFPMNLLFGNLWLFGGVLKKVMPSLSPADMTKPQFSYTFDCIKKVFPQYPPVPMIFPAGTDARHFTDICPCVLCFAPIRLSAQQLASVHGENENIDLDAIRDAVKFYKVFLESYM